MNKGKLEEQQTAQTTPQLSSKEMKTRRLSQSPKTPILESQKKACKTAKNLNFI